MKDRSYSVKTDGGKVYTTFNGITKEAVATDVDGEYYVEYQVGVSITGRVKVIYGFFIFPKKPKKCWVQLLNQEEGGRALSFNRVRGMKVLV